MEPVPAVAIILGLVDSLDTTLRTLHDFVSKHASEKFGSSYAHTEEALRNSCRCLIEVQSSLRPDWINSQLNGLLDVLENIEQHLDELQKGIQRVDRNRSRRYQCRIPQRRDTEAAVRIIVLAKIMIDMIRVVQGRGHRGKTLIDSVTSQNQDSVLLSKRPSTDLKRHHHSALLDAPNTKAHEIFACLAGPDGQEKVHEQCRAERLAGTCEWFLEREEFQSWLRTRDNAIFWCQGRPGIGKTMLASKIIDQLQPLHVVAYFYMNNGKPHSASDLITSLLRQLCLPLDIVPDRLQQIFERTNGDPGYRLELGDLLKALKEASVSIDQPVTIIIDGLDQTNIRDLSGFEKFFDSLRDTSWKCIVTSRDSQNIFPKAYNRFFGFIIEDQANEQDIYNFVESILKENEPVDRLLDSDLDFRSELIHTLALKAHGMFHWVPLQMRRILDQTHLSGIRKALLSIPNDIRAIVRSALKMIELQDKSRAELAKQALALLTAAQSPLTSGAMCHALGLAKVLDRKKRPLKLNIDKIPNSESIIECCMGIIKMDPTTKFVTLAHYDMLLEMREHRVQLFAPEPTEWLARTCIAYLSLSDFSKGPCHELDTFRKCLEEFPFLDYASRYWGYHARVALSLGTPDVDISDDIYCFLKTPMNHALSLQVSESGPEGKQTSLVLHEEKFLRVSELQSATRQRLTTIAQTIVETSPDMISKQDLCGRTALHEAALAGWEDIVTLLLEAGTNCSLEDDEGKTPFDYAAKGGHAKVISILEGRTDGSQAQQVTSLVSQGARSRDDQKKLEEALWDAAEAGNSSVVEQLLQIFVNPNAKKDDISAVTIAARRGHKGVVRLLLDAKGKHSDLDGLSSDCIPLHQAIKNGHEHVAATLLQFGANIQTLDNFGRTALFETLDTPDIRGAALLLKKGIDISCRDFVGDNVLHDAARRGIVEHASLFVDQGMEVALPNKEGLTPLHLAARHGHYGVARILFRKSAAVENIDSTGQTPLMYAASAGNTALCDTLLCLGASINALGVVPKSSRVDSGADKDDSGLDSKTPLVATAPAGHEQIDRIIFEKRTDDKASSFDYKTPLVAAASVGQEQSVRMFLEEGANINASSGSSKTPLMHAVSAGHIEVVRLLLERGADINASKSGSQSALVLAAEAGHAKIVELLIDHGAILDATEQDLEAAIELAEKAGHQAVVELLRARSEKKGVSGNT